MNAHEPHAPFVLRVKGEPEHDRPGLKQAIDELVTGPVASVHVERLSDYDFWLLLTGPGGERQVVLFSVCGKRGVLVARTGEE